MARMLAIGGNFYPRPPRGGRPAAVASLRMVTVFLSTPSARRATTAWMEQTDTEIFLSTPSARRATRSFELSVKFSDISIHALREEGDYHTFSILSRVFLFLSTPSARRATREPEYEYKVTDISIHALREEGDSKNRDKISIFKQIIQHSARI